PYSTKNDVTSIGGTCGSLTGDSSTINWSVSGDSSQAGTATCSSNSWSATLTTLSAEGNYTVSASQSDAAGNTGNSGSKSITIDKTAPVISAVSDTPDPTNSSSLISYTLSEHAT